LVTTISATLYVLNARLRSEGRMRSSFSSSRKNTIEDDEGEVEEEEEEEEGGRRPVAQA